jgi:hypothetical protein
MYSSKLRISRAHYQEMLTAIAEVTNPTTLSELITFFQLQPQITSAHTAIQWYVLKHSACNSIWISNNLYPYLNDTHIESALKAAFKELGITDQINRAISSNSSQ